MEIYDKPSAGPVEIAVVPVLGVCTAPALGQYWLVILGCTACAVLETSTDSVLSNNSWNMNQSNPLIISEIWLIQIAKKRLLWISRISMITSVKMNWFNSEKYCFTDKSVERQITDSISENLSDSDSESTGILKCWTYPFCNTGLVLVRSWSQPFASTGSIADYLYWSTVLGQYYDGGELRRNTEISTWDVDTFDKLPLYFSPWRKVK